MFLLLGAQGEPPPDDLAREQVQEVQQEIIDQGGAMPAEEGK